MKRIISLLLAFMMTLSMIPTVFAANGEIGFENFKETANYSENRFSDVKPSDWFSNGVKSAYELGLMNGDSATTFNPNGDMTIAEALAIACRIHNIYNGGNGVFASGNPWYQPYVDYAIQSGMIKSDEYNSYTKKASRANFANIIYASLPTETWAKINSIEQLPDVNKNDWYGTPVFALYCAGILTGNDEYGTFNPDSNIKRSEIATIVTRVATPSARRILTLQDLPTVNNAPDDIKDQMRNRAAAFALMWKLETAKITTYFDKIDNKSSTTSATEMRDLGDGIYTGLEYIRGYISEISQLCGNYDDVQGIKKNADSLTNAFKSLPSTPDPLTFNYRYIKQFLDIIQDNAEIWNNFISALQKLYGD